MTILYFDPHCVSSQAHFLSGTGAFRTSSFSVITNINHCRSVIPLLLALSPTSRLNPQYLFNTSVYKYFAYNLFRASLILSFEFFYFYFFSMTQQSHQITDDELYRNTSQYRLWSMTKEKLAELRHSVHDKAVDKVRQVLLEKVASLFTPEQIEDLILTYEEEQLLVLAYASKIERIALSFQMPSQVKATAVSYFKKFYLVHSVMDYHPKNVMYTCVFLAAKAENHFIPVTTFCKSLPKSEPAHILDLEFLVLESLSFTLLVQNGIRPLHGFFLDLQVVLPSTSKPELSNVLTRARDILLRGLLSDAHFHFTPPQIALAGLSLSNEDLVKKYLELKFSTKDISVNTSGEGIHALSVLFEVLKECKQTLQDFRVPESAHEKEIDKKLYRLLHPNKFLNQNKRKLERANSTATPETEPKRVRVNEEGASASAGGDTSADASADASAGATTAGER